MTNTTPRSIPTTGLRHKTPGVVVTAVRTYTAGYLIQVRIGGTIARHLCSGHTTETQALAAYTALVEQYPAETTPAPVKLQPAATGTQTYMSPAEVDLITGALTHTGGRITRGKLDIGSAPITVLHAMARRGYVTLTHPAGSPYRPNGAVVTDYGQRTAERLAPIAA